MRKLAKKLKKKIYFFVAGYFGFWASIYLRRWNPKIMAVVGSSGKTTILHLLESQMKSAAYYSHHANSAFGIPFNILGLSRKSYGINEWFLFALFAPFKAYAKIRKEKYYVAEADAERPGEGLFLSSLLKPHALIWLSLEEAHGINYDRFVAEELSGDERLEKVKAEMAEEFGNFARLTQEFAVLNEDNPFIKKQSANMRVKISWVGEKDILGAKVNEHSISFKTANAFYEIPKLVPLDVCLSAETVDRLLSQYGFPVDRNFAGFYLPPGRSSVFRGIRDIVIIDSTYNATIGGMKAMLRLFAEYPAKKKWLVLGDMIEQGKSEEREHELLSDYIFGVNPEKIVLVGPRLKKYAYADLSGRYGEEKVVSYEMPGEALSYLESKLSGGETILFKGARYLEGIVEKLLKDPKDASMLCRREQIWVKKRKEWGLEK